MNRKLTALTMSAAIAAGVGAAAVPAAGAFADGQGAAVTQSSRPSLEQAKQQLIKKTGTTRLSVVDGLGYAQDQIYVGAVLTEHQTVQFFVNPGDGWQPSGEKSLPQTYGTGEPTVTGANTQGAQYPMFVVEGGFTGNGTGQALLFAHDMNKGWGVMVGKGDRLVPSGHGYTDLGEMGLELKISIDGDGVVTTHSLWGEEYPESNAEQTSDPIVRTWTGTGGDTLTMRSEHGGPID